MTWTLTHLYTWDANLLCVKSLTNVISLNRPTAYLIPKPKLPISAPWLPNPDSACLGSGSKVNILQQV